MESLEHPHRLLVLDEGAEWLDLWKHLDQSGYRQIGTVSTGTHAVQLVGELQPDVVLIGLQSNADFQSVNVAHHIWQAHRIPVICLASDCTDEVMLRIKESSAFGFFVKPFDLGVLCTTIDLVAIHGKELRYQHHQVEELKTKVDQLQAFSEMVAHDLREPVQILVGYGDLITDASIVSNEALSGLRQMTLYSRKLHEIINGLYVLAHTDSNVQQIMGPVDTAAVLRASIDRLTPRLEAGNIRLKVLSHLAPVVGHPIWLEQVFVNLIENAIKYGRRADGNTEIQIKSYVHNKVVRYQVIDNGPGIPLDRQHNLFRAFSRANSGDEPGLGLGLAIVKRIITKMGGNLGIESGSNFGSTFWFELPAVCDGYVDQDVSRVNSKSTPAEVLH